MRNNCFSIAKPILEFPPRQNSLWQSLRQRRRYKITSVKAARKWWGNKDTQRLGRPSGGLGRHQGSALVLKAPVYAKNHLFQDDKLSPQWSTCKIFRNWQTRELIRWRDYCPSLRRDVKTYIGGCDVSLTLKAVRHKPYGAYSPYLYRLIDGKTSS